MKDKSIVLAIILLISFNHSVNLSPSVTLTNANNQSWAMVFGSPTADTAKAARIDVALTSQYLFGSNPGNVGAICAVTDTSGALSVAEHNAFSIEFYCGNANFCADTSNKVRLYMYHGILNSTGSAYDYIYNSGGELYPVLDYSMTGTGTSVDPYVWSVGFEFTSAEVATYFVPTSSQFLTCWSNPDNRIDSDMWKSWPDLGNTAGFVNEVPVVKSTPSNSPANVRSDAFNFNIVKQGLIMVVIFFNQQIV